MKRPAFMAAVGATLVAAMLASCSSDNTKPLEPVDQPSTDSPAQGGSVMSGGGWSPAVEAASQSSNKVTVCHSGNGKNYTQITVSVQGAAAHLGESKNGKGGHANDYRVSTNTTCPPPATPSNLQVCKVAGPGVATAANFTFVLAANGETKTITVPAGAGPNGTCVSGGDYRVGTTVSIHENAQQGISTTGITVSPAGAQQGTSDLPGGNATVIIGTGVTTVTYTNRGPTGSLVICKVAGTGVTAGTNFTFAIPGQTATVAAGAAPNGTCTTTPLTVGAGNVTVTEAATTGVGVTSVTATNGGANVLVSSDLAARTATVTITAGQTTTVTYTNGAAAANGSLVICKVAGTGVTAGTNFTFTAAGQSATVAAGAAPNGTCTATPLAVAAGNVTVTEAQAAGTSVTAFTATGNGGVNALVSSDFGGRTATVTVVAGQTTTVTFTNSATTATGTLIICKIGGTGVAAGTNFNFTAGTQIAVVAAGAAPNGTCSTAMTLPVGPATVTEAAVANTSVQSITGTPTPTTRNLAGRSATVQITAGQETRITFTNVSP
jgi:hypothetical protein